ncbi:PPK2 family polyphosphate kinase [Glutamicibacter creatinolyticus]|uniref:PPK2 family polyphosphate kinase n=1 Tax=Glutamicibacter creatinolyticus TaxID=162496 RepID=UPI0033E06109
MNGNVENSDLILGMRVGGEPRLAERQTGRPHWWPVQAPQSKAEGKKALEHLGEQLSDDQEKLFASAIAGGSKDSVLLILQGMDTSGKGGIVRHVLGLVDPQGVSHHSFKAPTPEERAHDFLWRIERQVPQAGMIGVFDRSHYEDVLVHRVRKLSTAEEVESRYGRINDFEQRLVNQGTRVLKVFLHLSREEQYQRLMARLDDPTKHWKFATGDVDDRLLWDEYQSAYEIAISRTNTKAAPWYVVPADHKWAARWCVAKLLLQVLGEINPQWPQATYDVAAQRARLEAAH